MNENRPKMAAGSSCGRTMEVDRLLGISRRRPMRAKVCCLAALLLATNFIWATLLAADCASPTPQHLEQEASNCVNKPTVGQTEDVRKRRSAFLDGQKTHVKIGILLEESNYEQANMFIRTIKMINEQRDETIGLLLAMFAASQRHATAAEAFETAVPPPPPQIEPPGRPSDKKAADSRARWRRLAHGQHGGNLTLLPVEETSTSELRSERVGSETLGGHAESINAGQRVERGATGASWRAPPPLIHLEPVIEFLSDRQSALEADEKVCQLIASGVRAIMGPLQGQSIQHVQSICDTLEIPYFELRPFIGGGGSGSSSLPIQLQPPPPPQMRLRNHDEPHPSAAALRVDEDGPEPEVAEIDESSPSKRPVRQSSSHQMSPSASSVINSNKLEELTLNLHPPSQLLNAAYIDLIYASNWTSFAIVYESDDSMIRLQDIFKESSPAGSWTNKWRIRLFRHDASGTAGSGAEETQAKQASQLLNKSNSSATLAGEEHSNERVFNSEGQTMRQSARHRPLQTGTFRDVFWRLKLSGEHNILLDVSTGSLYEALKSAQQVGCMTEEFSYLVTSLDLHVIDLEDFKYSRTKITSLSLLQVAKLQQSTARTSSFSQAGSRAGSDAFKGPFFDERYLETLGVHLMAPASQQAGSASKQQQRFEQQTALGGNRTFTSYASSWMSEAESNDQTRRELLQSSPASLGLLPTVDRNNEQRLLDFFLEQQERNLSRVRLTTASALLHDSLVLLALGLEQLDPDGGTSQTSANEPQDAIFCSPNSTPWQHGSSLVNYMRQTSFTGLTGRIAFDQRGLRNDLKLDVMGMAPNIRLVKIGEWHSKGTHDEDEAREFRRAPQEVASASIKGNERRQITTPEEDGKGAQSRGSGGKEARNSQQRQPSIEEQTSDEFKSYDELSSRYESELGFYMQQLAAGKQVHVPYTKRVTPSGALLVNEIIFERLYREQADKIDTLVVTAKLSQPYFMLKETPNKLDGNDQYEGYAVDLIHELSKLVNFKYKWREVGDKKYGSKEVLPNGTIVWNGMIGEIVRGQADLAIVDLTITAQREEAVDFTLPFMNTGISILFKKPTTKVTTLFSFLSPFSSDVWAYVLAAYCGISAILFLVGHLSPYEWADPHPCRHLNPDADLTVLKNQFSLLNSFWFTIGSLMQQGSDLTPRSMSTRTIAGIWYFFTLIMISSYTANLAAFLTVEKVVYPIENVRDLGNQEEIKYGCVESGSTCLFFQDSQIDTYKRIDETMRRHRTYVRSNDEGQKRVGEGKFAFFMESTTIEYIIERNCNLTQIGGLIDSKGYGLATSKKSRHKRPYRTLLNEGILHLQETGMLHVLKNRWWKEKRGGGTCTDDGKGGGVTELSLANVGGVFVVLLGGLGISFLVAIAEFIWRARRSGSTRDRMCEEMMNDLKFALACKSSTKPISKSGNGNNYKRRPPAAQQQVATTGNRQSSGDDDYYARYLQTNCNQSDLFTMAGGGKNSLEFLSADQRQPPFANQMKPTGGKPCDPILLHAMLTMLAQQQPQVPQAQQQSLEQQPELVKRTTSQPYLVAKPASLNGLHNGSRQMMMSHSATVDENLTSRQFKHFSSTLDGGFGRSFSDGELDDELAEDGDERTCLEPIHSQEAPNGFLKGQQLVHMAGARKSESGRGHYARSSSQQPNGSAAAPINSDTGRRRLLHAQQTIDID